MLSEISQTQKYCVILLNMKYLEWQIHRDRKQIRVYQRLRRGAMESSCRELTGAEFPLGVMKNFENR